MHPRLKLFLGACIISFSAVFVKDSTISPDAAVFYRTAIGGAAFFLLSLVKGDFWKRRLPSGFALLAGIFFAADLFCWHKSIHFAGPGLATLLGNLQIFVIAFVGVVFLKERLGKAFVFSSAAAFAGLFLIVSSGTSRSIPHFREGFVLGILTSIFYAFYVLVLKRAQKNAEGSSTSLLMFFVSASTALIALAYLLFSGQSLAMGNLRNMTDMLLYGLVCQFAGWLLITSALRRVKASVAALFLLMQPALSYLWDILLFGKSALPVELAGAAVVMIAVYAGNRLSEK